MHINIIIIIIMVVVVITYNMALITQDSQLACELTVSGVKNDTMV